MEPLRRRQSLRHGSDDVGQDGERRHDGPGADIIGRLSRGLGIPIESVLGLAIPPGADHDAGRPEHAVEVPIRAVASGGPPVEAEDLDGETYTLLRHLYREGRYVIRLSGDSMYPHFWNGDLILVEPADRVKNGAVAIVKVNGESTVKRVYRGKKGGYILKGDNPTFPPIEADAGEVEIVARVLRIVEGERP